MNSTFYRPASVKTLNSWVKRTKDRDFSFTLKVPGAITHESLISDTNASCKKMYDFEKSHLEVLSAAGKLGAVLVQLPPYFREEHLDKLLQLLSSFSVRDYRVFIEVRQKSLYLNHEFESAVQKEGANMVSVDSPEARIEENYHSGSPRKYIRLHGRNTAAWWKKNAGRDEKYDYEYSRQELEDVKATIMSGVTPGDEIFIYFNNHPMGKAPRNATIMMELMGQTVTGNRQKTII